MVRANNFADLTVEQTSPWIVASLNNSVANSGDFVVPTERGAYCFVQLLSAACAFMNRHEHLDIFS